MSLAASPERTLPSHQDCQGGKLPLPSLPLCLGGKGDSLYLQQKPLGMSSQPVWVPSTGTRQGDRDAARSRFSGGSSKALRSGRLEDGVCATEEKRF